MSPAAWSFTAFRDPNRPDAVRWGVAEVTLTLQQDGSDDVSDGSDLEAIRQAVATWNAALGDGLRLGEGPPSAERSYGRDPVNRIAFLEGSSWPAGASSALGLTFPNVDVGAPSVFHDVDIVLNGNKGPWSTDGNPLGVDIRSVVTHELGHLVGLWHAYHEDAVMYFGARKGTTFRRVLHNDDVQGAAFLTGGGQPCDDDFDCPFLFALPSVGGSNLRLRCAEGACQAGAAAYAAECYGNGDCASGRCQRDAWAGSTEPGACTQGCADDCPAGALCLDSWCVPDRLCVEDQDCGGGSNDLCLFDFDGRYRCRHVCLEDQHCTAPARCIDLGYGTGVCHEPGTAPNGVACLSPMSCEGLACRGDEVTLRCQTAPPYQDGGSTPDVPAVDAGAVIPDRRGGEVGRDTGVGDDTGSGTTDAGEGDGSVGHGDAADPGPGDARSAAGDAIPAARELGSPEGCACAAPGRNSTTMWLGGALWWWRRRERRADQCRPKKATAA